mgnify:CR=1 FL=1
MNYKATSRKDDLISMCYVLTYLCHGGELLGIHARPKLTEDECFELTIKTKRVSTIENLCFGNSEYLKDFVLKIFNMEFDETPDYAKLKYMLRNALRPRKIVAKFEDTEVMMHIAPAYKHIKLGLHKSCSLLTKN